jgi:two-component system OmpR family response regulator
MFIGTIFHTLLSPIGISVATRNVLLVDDDGNIRMVAQMALEDVAGWNVIAVESGAEALKVLADVRPDLILLDMMMPGMDGKTTLAKLHAEGFADIPVIFMTAKVQSDEIDEYKALGAVGVITKPFDPMKLADDIERTLKT